MQGATLERGPGPEQRRRAYASPGMVARPPPPAGVLESLLWLHGCIQPTPSRNRLKRSLISATAATSLMGTFLMGAVANLPLAVAPGMG